MTRIIITSDKQLRKLIGSKVMLIKSSSYIPCGFKNKVLKVCTCQDYPENTYLFYSGNDKLELKKHYQDRIRKHKEAIEKLKKELRVKIANRGFERYSPTLPIELNVLS